ncbi:MAG TPA: hypothetical protein VIL83_04070 [Capillibacterium sp.]
MTTEPEESSTREQKVDALLATADHWLTEAEKAPDPEKAWRLCRQALQDLLLAMLWGKGGPEGTGPDLDLSRLWEACVRAEPELLLLTANFEFFLREDGFPSAADRDLLLDAANEIWDFIFGALTE